MTRLQISFRTEGEKDAQTESESFYCKDNLFLVAEGMGGDYLGEMARETAKQGISSSFFKHLKKEQSPGVAMVSALREVNGEMLEESGKIGKRMAASVSVVYISGRIMYFSHLGDSRIYCLQGGEIVQLTRDHTLGEEDSFAELGGGDPRLLKALTDGLGIHDNPDIKVKTFGLRDKDVILMTTEGLTRYLSNMQILKLSMKQNSVKKFAARLLEEVQRKGARDSMTLGIIRVRDFSLPLHKTGAAAAVVVALVLVGGVALKLRRPAVEPPKEETVSVAPEPSKSVQKPKERKTPEADRPPAPPKPALKAPEPKPSEADRQAASPRPALKPPEQKAPEADRLPPPPARPSRPPEEAGKREAPSDQGIQQFLGEWKRAWENTSGPDGNISAYMAFYAEDFSSEGLDKNGWRKAKAERNKKKQWIKIELKNISIQGPTSDNRVEVRLQQDYRSSNFSVTTGKSLVLKKGSTGWKIVSERAI